MQSRPKDEEDLERKAAAGVIHAAGFVRKYARSDKKINLETVNAIHKEIWKNIWPEIAGQFRTEEVKISGSKHLPPHPTKIPGLMKQADAELISKINNIGPECKGLIIGFDEISNELVECIDKVVTVAAWIHHKITFIHPFFEGNGRTARLAANLILERYGLVGISVKIEKENKNAYRKALAQIDNNSDYEPLKKLIYEGLNERYNGVPMKYYPATHKKPKAL
ncbi:MAG: Fic family protein [Patescibacteria group bacterium]|jgi:fido (protein-threonine AMPylation protein)